MTERVIFLAFVVIPVAIFVFYILYYVQIEHIGALKEVIEKLEQTLKTITSQLKK